MTAGGEALGRRATHSAARSAWLVLSVAARARRSRTPPVGAVRALRAGSEMPERVRYVFPLRRRRLHGGQGPHVPVPRRQRPPPAQLLARSHWPVSRPRRFCEPGRGASAGGITHYIPRFLGLVGPTKSRTRSSPPLGFNFPHVFTGRQPQ